MERNAKWSLLFILLLIFYLPSLASNRLEFEQVSHQGNHLVVNLNLANEDTIAGFQVPLYLALLGDYLRCDSISFAGGRCSNFQYLNSSIKTDTKNLYLEGICQVNPDSNSSPIFPGDGMIARLYFTILADPGHENLRIGKGAIPKSNRDRDFLFWTPGAKEVECSFKESNINLK